MNIDKEPLPNNGKLEEAERILRLILDESAIRTFFIALATTYFSVIKHRKSSWVKEG